MLKRVGNVKKKKKMPDIHTKSGIALPLLRVGGMGFNKRSRVAERQNLSFGY